VDQKLYNKLGVTAACGLLVIAFSAGHKCGTSEQQAIADKNLNDRLESLASSHENAVRERQERVRSLEELLSYTKGQLDDKTSEAAVLAELVKKLRDRPADVQIVTKFEKVYLPGETLRIPVPESLPDRHDLIRWDDETPVAKLDIAAGELSASACGMEFNLREVHGKTDSSFLLFAKSGCDGILRDTPITNVTVTRVDPEKLKLFSPRLGLGVMAGATIPKAGPVLGAALYLELLHPGKNVSLLSPQIGLGTHITGGLNLVGYNIGGPLPLVDDLWLHLGGGYGAKINFVGDSLPGVTDPSWAAWVTVGTQL
jgi:hypothetical protein